MAHDPDVIGNAPKLVHDDGNLTSDWFAALVGQDSPLFILSELDDVNMEEDMIINNTRIETIQPLQFNHLDQPFQPIHHVHPRQRCTQYLLQSSLFPQMKP
jgi:hypothetical protein